MDGIRERRVGELGEGSRGGAKDREGVEGKSQLGQSEERGREGQRERSSGFSPRPSNLTPCGTSIT